MDILSCLMIWQEATTRRAMLNIFTGSAAAAPGFALEIGFAPHAHHHPQKAAFVPYVLKHFNPRQAQTIRRSPKRNLGR